MAALGVVGPGSPGHALALTSVSDVTKVGALPWCSGRCAHPRYYDPVGLPLRSARFHHWPNTSGLCWQGCANGSLLSRTRRCVRADPRAPEGPDQGHLWNWPRGRTWAFAVR